MVKSGMAKAVPVLLFALPLHGVSFLCWKQDTAQYHSQSPIYTAHKLTSTLHKSMEFRCILRATKHWTCTIMSQQPVDFTDIIGTSI